MGITTYFFIVDGVDISRKLYIVNEKQ